MPGPGACRLGPFLCLPLAPCCLWELASRFPLLPSPPLPALPPLRKSGPVRQLKLPLGADFPSPNWLVQAFAAKFFAAGAGLCGVAPRRHIFQKCRAGKLAASFPPSPPPPLAKRERPKTGRENGEGPERVDRPLLYPPQQQLNPEQSGPEGSKLQLLPREFTSALNNNNKNLLGLSWRFVLTGLGWFSNS